MKALFLHAREIDVIPREKALEISDQSPEKIHMENALIVFLAFERGDQEEFLDQLLNDVLEHLPRIKANHVLLYPYVHLTSNPESPVRSKTLLEKAYQLFQKRVPTFKAPFGWYKEFKIHVYGHPLSELSREYKKGKEIISQSLKQEEELKSEFYIFDGELHPIEEYDFSKYPNLKKLADYETKKSRAYESEPVHIELMKRLELVDYEPASDSGNLRYYPKGRLIKKIIENSVTHYCIESGAHEVETPIMYDFAHPSLEKYLNRFPARQYTIHSDQRMFFLRFAACFGQFLIAHDVPLSYKQLPVKLYELTRYSFRREQSGELMGLKRLRAFTMPDMHTLVRDFDQAREEFLKQLETSRKIMEEYELYSHIEIAFRAQKDFFQEHIEWYRELQRIVGKPFLLELFDKRYAYFITKFEFNFIDSKEKAAALSTVQIDVENAHTYDITYVDEDGKKKRPLILHASLSGAVERVMFALLEKEGMKIKKGEKGRFPFFLSPIQIRIIPVSQEYMEKAHEIWSLLKDVARVDLDDRDETLSKKIREAQQEWVPYIVVIGEKEVKEGTLSVTIRETGEKKTYSLEQLKEELKSKQKHFEELNMPYLLSKRVKFR